MPTRTIALLRGINVGGSHIIKMEALRALFEELDLANVRTYIQSGNVFFDVKGKVPAGLSARIEKHLRDRLGYEVPVCLRSVAEFEAALEAAPYRAEPAADERHMVLFATKSLAPAAEFPITSPKGDCEILGASGREIYLRLKVINGRMGDPKALIKANFGAVVSTGRFYHTAKKILAAAKG